MLIFFCTFVSASPVIVSPTQGEIAPLQNAGQKAYFALDFDARLSYMEHDSIGGHRSEMQKVTSRPLPVRFAWEGGEAPFSLAVYRGDNLFTITNGIYDSEVELYNFQTGRRYDFVVTDSAGESAQSHFYTEYDQPRFLHVSATEKINGWIDYYSTNPKYRNYGIGGLLPNFRDIGGVFTADGTKRVKQGLLYRSPEFNWHGKGYPEYNFGIDKAVMDDLLGIRYDVDLRNESEAQSAVSFLGKRGSPLGDFAVRTNFVTLVNSYTVNSLSTNVDGVAMQFFADKENYPLVFHCIAGQDRTGVYEMLIYSILGVDEEDIFKGWEASAFFQGKDTFYAGKLRTFIDDFGAYGTPEDTLSECVVRALKAKGIVTDELIAKMRDALLEDAEECSENPRPKTQKVKAPDPNGVARYFNGRAQYTYLRSNAKYTISMTNNAVNIGSYPVTFSLRTPETMTWEDGTTNDVVASFVINPPQGYLINEWEELPMLSKVTFHCGDDISISLGRSLYGNVRASLSEEEIAMLVPGEYKIEFTVDETLYYGGLTYAIDFVVTDEELPQNPGTYYWLGNSGKWRDAANWSQFEGSRFPIFGDDYVIIPENCTRDTAINLGGSIVDLHSLTNAAQGNVTISNGTMRISQFYTLNNSKKTTFRDISMLAAVRKGFSVDDAKIFNYANQKGGGFVESKRYPYVNNVTNEFCGNCYIEPTFRLERDDLTLIVRDGVTTFCRDFIFRNTWIASGYDMTLNIGIDNARICGTSWIGNKYDGRNHGHYLIDMCLGENNNAQDAAISLTGQFVITSGSTLRIDARNIGDGEYKIIEAAEIVDAANFFSEAQIIGEEGGDYRLTHNATSATLFVSLQHRHIWGDWTTNVVPTCVMDGIMSRTCQSDDCPIREATEVLPAYGHDYRISEEREATDEHWGETIYTCHHCGAEYAKENSNASGLYSYIAQNDIWGKRANWSGVEGGYWPHKITDSAIIESNITDNVTIDLCGETNTISTLTINTKAQTTIKNGTLNLGTILTYNNRQNITFENITISGNNSVTNEPNIFNFSDNPNNLAKGPYPYYNYNTNTFIGNCNLENIDFVVQREDLTFYVKDGQTHFNRPFEFRGNWKNGGYNINFNLIVENGHLYVAALKGSKSGSENSGHYSLRLILGENNTTTSPALLNLTEPLTTLNETTLYVDARGKPSGRYKLLEAPSFSDKALVLDHPNIDTDENIDAEISTHGGIVYLDLIRTLNPIVIVTDNSGIAQTNELLSTEFDLQQIVNTVSIGSTIEIASPIDEKISIILPPHITLVLPKNSTNISLLPSNPWYDIHQEGQNITLSLNASATPKISSLTIGKEEIVIQITGRKPGLTYYLLTSQTFEGLSTATPIQIDHSQSFENKDITLPKTGTQSFLKLLAK